MLAAEPSLGARPPSRPPARHRPRRPGAPAPVSSTHRPMRLAVPPLELQLRSLKILSGHLQTGLKKHLWAKVLLGLVAGSLAGLLLRPELEMLEPRHAAALAGWLALPGRLYLGLVQMIAVPLLFASIIRGLAVGEDLRRVRSLALVSLAFFLLLATIGATAGFLAEGLLQPARVAGAPPAPIYFEGAPVPPAELPLGKSVPEALVGLIPKNPVSALVNADMAQVVLFALILGVALLSLPPTHARPLYELLGSLLQVSSTIVGWAVRLAPLAVFGLMAELVAEHGPGVWAILSGYLAAVLAGLAVLLTFDLLVIWGLTGLDPVRFLRRAAPAPLLALSTASSATAMPLSIKKAEDVLCVRPAISHVVVPLGATLNLGGTAVVQAVATVFLLDVFDIPFTFGHQVLLVLTAVTTSIGAPATPGVAIFILATVLTAAGVPPAGIALVIGVDRVVELARAAVNVVGDLAATAVVDRLMGGRARRTAERA